jgi:hypothetical protein
VAWARSTAPATRRSTHRRGQSAAGHVGGRCRLPAALRARGSRSCGLGPSRHPGRLRRRRVRDGPFHRHGVARGRLAARSPAHRAPVSPESRRLCQPDRGRARGCAREGDSLPALAGGRGGPGARAWRVLAYPQGFQHRHGHRRRELGRRGLRTVAAGGQRERDNPHDGGGIYPRLQRRRSIGQRSGCDPYRRWTPGRLARTSFQLSSFGNFAKLTGSGPAAVHGLSKADDFSQVL